MAHQALSQGAGALIVVSFSEIEEMDCPTWDLWGEGWFSEGRGGGLDQRWMGFTGDVQVCSFKPRVVLEGEIEVRNLGLGKRSRRFATRDVFSG